MKFRVKIILNIIGKKKELPEIKIGENKSKIDLSLKNRGKVIMLIILFIILFEIS